MRRGGGNPSSFACSPVLNALSPLACDPARPRCAGLVAANRWRKSCAGCPWGWGRAGGPPLTTWGGQWGWLISQLQQDAVPISHALGQDWGDTCFLDNQKCPCGAPSPSLSVPVPMGLKMLRTKPFLWRWGVLPGGQGGAWKGDSRCWLLPAGRA